MATTRPGNQDRGWNDPPMFLYNAEAEAQKTPKRTLLNKRVPYPQSSAAEVTQPGLGTNLLTSTAAPPPPQPGNILLLPPTSATGTASPNQPLLVPLSANTDKIHTTTQADTTTHSVKDVTKIIENFHFNDDTEKMGFMKEKLDTVLEDCKSIIQQRVYNDINKKKQILYTFWEQGKLSEPVKDKMCHLVTALDRRECDRAYDIHMALMVDFVAEVSQWMVGIKRLIQEVRKLPLVPSIETKPACTEMLPTEELVAPSVEEKQDAVEGEAQNKDSEDTVIQSAGEPASLGSEELSSNSENINQS